MKLTKIIMAVGVLSLLVAGTALAWGGPNNMKDMTYEERQEYRAANGCVYNGERITNVDIIADLTGKSIDEVRDLCTELREEDKTIADYLKEQGLYEEFKSKVIANFQEKIDAAVENGRIDSEKAQEIIESIKEKIENGQLVNGTRSGINMKAKMGTGMGCGQGRGRGNSATKTGRTF